MLAILVGLVITVATLAAAWYYACVHNATYWERRGIPGPKSDDPIYNHLKALASFDYPSCYAIRDWTKKYGPVYGILEGWQKILIISEPKMAHELFVTKFDHFHGRKLNPLVGNVDKEKRVHVFNARGARWKRLRTIASPSFSISGLKKIYPTVDHACREMIRHLDMAFDTGKSFNIHPYFHELTMDVICRVAMGQKGTRQFDNPNVELVKNVFLRFGSGPFDRFAWLFPGFGSYIRKLAIGMAMIVHNPIKHLIDELYVAVEQRKRERASGAYSTTSPDFIDLFLDTEEAEVVEGQFERGSMKVSKVMTTDEIVGQCFVFLLAGFDTTANTLGTTSFLLAQHPEIQERLIEEIDDVCPDAENITFNQVNELRYCDAVMKEALRMYPIAAFAASRECMQTSTLGDVKVEVGVNVMADVLSLHYNQRVWGENADQFCPERFFDVSSEQQMAYYPFGGGLRTCIGMRLAYVEEKLALAHILKRYRIKTCPQTERQLKMVGRSVLNPEAVTIMLERR